MAAVLSSLLPLGACCACSLVSSLLCAHTRTAWPLHPAATPRPAQLYYYYPPHPSSQAPTFTKSIRVCGTVAPLRHSSCSTFCRSSLATHLPQFHPCQPVHNSTTYRRFLLSPFFILIPSNQIPTTIGCSSDSDSTTNNNRLHIQNKNGVARSRTRVSGAAMESREKVERKRDDDDDSRARRRRVVEKEKIGPTPP